MVLRHAVQRSHDVRVKSYAWEPVPDGFQIVIHPSNEQLSQLDHRNSESQLEHRSIEGAPTIEYRKSTIIYRTNRL
jgi:hypothetical protein